MKFKERFCHEIEGLKEKGFSNDECARLFGVSRQAISYWIRHIPEFRRGYKKGLVKQIENEDGFKNPIRK